MSLEFNQYLQQQLDEIKAAGTFKEESVICSPQSAAISFKDGRKVINFCANNYLGLSNHPAVVAGAKKALDSHGFGLSSVRFICGTQDIHKELERRISEFFGTEDTILYAACFDANGGVFAPLLDENDAIISDALNHASIIDGIRLCKAERYRYDHADMNDLEKQLKAAQNKRHKLIVTDGVFSMDGDIAKMGEIVALAEKYNAMIMSDECHSAGFIGQTGRGSAEYHGVHGKVNIITGTLGKALGGGLGGFTTGSKEVVAMLRQHSRPYLFSNSLSPAIIGASLAVFDLIENDTSLRDKLMDNAAYFKERIIAAGFDIKPTESAIMALMLYDAPLSQKFAKRMMEEGIYVIGFNFPVVPKGQARIRIQISAAHEKAHLDKAIKAFTKVGKELGVI
ncbi:MAG: glycine C-acetyltransferase [Bacteroidetes bacterium]|nr:glycine C-acetyltransferase [Bacteroidota bacterium]